MKNVVHKVALGEEPSDFAYWQTRPYSERLEALEQIRREYHQWAYGGEPKMQKVCNIVKQYSADPNASAG